jgi:hypothetical protein
MVMIAEQPGINAAILKLLLNRLDRMHAIPSRESSGQQVSDG